KAADATIERARAVLESVPPAARKQPWHFAARHVRKVELEHAVLSQDLDRMERLAKQLEGDPSVWSPAFRNSYEAEFDRALARQYLGTHAYFRDALSESTALYGDAIRRFEALLERRSSDPDLLYALMWTS